MAATALAGRSWSKRSWMVLIIPALLLPLGAVLGWLYLIGNWGGGH